jgi:Do/DeqQ family serine protease
MHRAIVIALAVLSAAPWTSGAAFAQGRPPAAGVLEALEEAFVAVADRVTPAVVNVSVKSRRPSGPEGQEPELPESFERFFRRRPPREGPRSAGSGVIVDPRGYILTNHHVVEDASAVEVRLSDDRKFPARVIGRDPKTDLAVLKVDAPEGSLPVAELGDSDALRIGQWAIAIGNPFGLDRTVTVGIVSATGRTRVGVAAYEAFIQTDASINPGNSGGPLLNLRGQVIGINTAIVSNGQGIGFSIPINLARDIMRQLIDRGRVVRGWLGIVIQDLTPELAQGFGVPAGRGVVVAEVAKDSPAEKGGLRAGDIITEFGGVSIKDVTELQRRVAAVEPGRPTPVAILRDRAPLTLTIAVGEQPGEEAIVERESGGEELLGLTVEPLTPELARRFRLSARSGVVVTAVAAGSSGDQAGIRPGDAILDVNRRPVADVEGFRRALAAVAPGTAVPVYIQRGGGRNEYVVLTVPERRR